MRKQTRSHVTGHFALGDPASELLRVVHDLNADVLIVGTRDSADLKRFLLGSVAETLMRKAGCPVMVVRPKAHKH